MRKAERQLLDFDRFKEKHDLDEKEALKEYGKIYRGFNREKDLIKKDIIEVMKKEKTFKESYETVADLLAENILYKNLILQQFLLDGGNFVERSAADTAKSNPLFTFLKDINKDIRDLLKELGMTPASFKKINDDDGKPVVNILGVLESMDNMFSGDSDEI